MEKLNLKKLKEVDKSSLNSTVRNPFIIFHSFILNRGCIRWSSTNFCDTRATGCRTIELKEVESNEQHRVEISRRFAALENLDTEVSIDSAWETSRESIRISAEGSHGYYEVKKHKPWFDEGCLELLD
jgi:hypothetical protein